MKILARLEKNLNFWFLVIISLVFFLLRFPSLFEPEWYGDEGIYQTLGLGINAGRLLYRDIFDNKPPLLYMLYSFVNSDQFATRLLSLIFGLLSIWLLYLLAKKIIESRKAIYFSISLFAVLFGLPLIEGNIANAENYMLLLNILAGLLIFKSININSRKKHLALLSLSGLVLGLSLLFKIVAVFDFAAFFAFIVIVNFPSRIREILNKKIIFDIVEKVFIFTISFFIPIALTTLFFAVNDALPYFLKAVLFNNVGYVGWKNNFIIPQGLLIVKLILLFLFSLFIFLKRNAFGKNFIFASLWLAFSLFDVFFSQRPYTHYVLVILPSFCLMVGLIYLNNKLSKLAGIITLSSLILILLTFGFYTKIIPYYQNFLTFVAHRESVNDYQYFFDHSTPLNYEISNYILSRNDKNENTFLWGNNAQVYNLLDTLPPGRYTVAYHISGYKDGLENTQEAITKNPPKYILVMPNVPPYPFSLSMYNLKINLDGVKIYEKYN